MWWGSKILTEAILGASLRSDNLNAFWFNGLRRNRSELGNGSSTFLSMEGPVSSNLLAPPTKHTATLEPGVWDFRPKKWRDGELLEKQKKMVRRERIRTGNITKRQSYQEKTIFPIVIIFSILI